MESIPPPPAPGSIQGAVVHLSTTADQIDRAARRSRRFSWYCWGFLFATYGGFLVFGVVGSLFSVVTTTTSSTGTSVTTTYPWWDLPVSATLPVGVLLLAVREVLLGRRELAAPSMPAHPIGSSLGWTETVQQCQRKTTHAKSETEWSFVPLVLGLFGLAEFWAFFVFDVVSPGGTLYILFAPVIGFAALGLLWPFYRAARRWILAYQGLLDRQVSEFARLEAEFFWRFAGTPPAT